MPANRQPELYAAALITYTAAAMALAMRIVARQKTKMALVWEDYLAVVAFIVGSAFTFLSIAKMRWGLGMHIEEIDHMPMKQIIYHYYLDLWVDMWLYTFSVGLSKFVILGLYWRMFGLSTIRQPIRILFACSAGWIIVRVTLILLQCQPIPKFWHKDLPGGCTLSPMKSLFAAGIPHFVLEVAILVCPLVEIWKLHLPMAKKLVVGAMFMSGLLTCGSALGTIAHTISLDKKHTDPDLTWDGLDDQIWAVCDVNLASFATSLPLLRPVFRSFGGIFSSFKSNAIPPETHGNAPTRLSYRSAPSNRMQRRASETDSVVEFAGQGGSMANSVCTSKETVALSDIPPTVSEVGEHGDMHV